MHIRTMLDNLDKLLRGGAPPPRGSVTEIVGPSRTGKTQISHMLAIQAVAPVEMDGCGGSILYMDTLRKGCFTGKIGECGRDNCGAKCGGFRLDSVVSVIRKDFDNNNIFQRQGSCFAEIFGRNFQITHCGEQVITSYSCDSAAFNSSQIYE